MKVILSSSLNLNCQYAYNILASLCIIFLNAAARLLQGARNPSVGLSSLAAGGIYKQTLIITY